MILPRVADEMNFPAASYQPHRVSAPTSLPLSTLREWRLPSALALGIHASHRIGVSMGTKDPRAYQFFAKVAASVMYQVAQVIARKGGFQWHF